MEFPCLLRSKVTGNIVIATGMYSATEFEGTLIKVGTNSSGDYEIGEYCTDWALSIFEEYKKVVAVHI